MMKKPLLLLVLLLCVFPLSARDTKVRDIDITLTLIRNGIIVVHERWDIDTGDQITEWYLVRSNLGDIEITDFCVYDGDNDRLEDDGEWDVDRTLAQKAGRFGIVHKRDGVELCWGVGSYGDHCFHALYAMTRAVKTLNDYDMLHLQVVSPGLSSPPQHVKVTVRPTDDYQLDTTNTRIWGFGYEGTSTFADDGSVVFETDGPMLRDDSVIILLRFDKGIFISPSVQDRDFGDALETALEEASFADDYTDEEENPWPGAIGGLASLIFIYYVFIKPFFRFANNKPTKKDIRKILGVSYPNAVSWWRDIPFKKGLDAAEYTLKGIGEDKRKGGLPLAEIMRMIYRGYLKVNREIEGAVEIRFTDKDISDLDGSARDLYKMLKEAAGDNHVLEEKEFSAWAVSNASRVYRWSQNVITQGSTQLKDGGWYLNGEYTREGQVEARRLMGLRKFLSEFTLIKEREAFEAGLWKEYMVYGALFGIAERVAKQLKDIDPKLFQETFQCDYDSFGSVMTLSSSLASSLASAVLRGTPTPSYSSYSGSSSSSSGHSRSGYGGHSSRSGGHGYSGGGRGGGGR